MSQNETLKSENLTQWDYNGIILTIDMHDVDDSKRYEDAFEKMGEKEKRLKKEGKNSEILLEFCNLFRELFDDLFGEGTSQKMFGNKNNVKTILEAYDQFLEFIKGQGNAVSSIRESIVGRYSPNRAQRRAVSKGR